MAEAEPIALALSQEELAYLLSLLDAPFIPGLGEALPTSDLPAVRLLLDAAARSLAVRGLLWLNLPQPPQMAELPHTLLGACAYPQHSLLIEPQEEEAIASYFHANHDALIVEHRVPIAAVHVFSVYDDEATALARLQALLGLDGQPAPEGEAATLDGSSFAIVLDLLSSGLTERAVDALEQLGVPPTSAYPLASALGGLEARTSIISVAHHPKNPTLNQYTLLRTNQGFWLAQHYLGESGQGVEIKPISSAELSGQLRDWLFAPKVTVE